MKFLLDPEPETAHQMAAVETTSLFEQAQQSPQHTQIVRVDTAVAVSNASKANQILPHTTRFAFYRSLSARVVLLALAILSVAMYTSAISIIRLSWTWLNAYYLDGVATLGLVFGALGLVWIFYSLYNEKNALRLLERYTRYTGAVVLLSCLFLGGAWVTIQGVRLVLRPLAGDWLSMPIALAAFAWFIQRLTQAWLMLSNAPRQQEL
jgi:hypothetical protein